MRDYITIGLITDINDDPLPLSAASTREQALEWAIFRVLLLIGKESQHTPRGTLVFGECTKKAAEEIEKALQKTLEIDK